MLANEENLIAQMLSMRRIAVVGVSADAWKPSHAIAKYLMECGYDVIPVNPLLPEVLGVKCRASLKEIAGEIELVNVFRRSEFIPGVVREAIDAGAKAVWVQSGIISPEGERLALSAGISYIENRCIMVEHARQR